MTVHVETAGPAYLAGSAPSDGSHRRIALRRSPAVRWAIAIFVMIATSAMFTCLAPRPGAGPALPLVFTVFILLAASARGWERTQPRWLRIGANGLWLWNERDATPVQARITGCSQWSNRLLILAIAGETGPLKPLFIAADAVPASVFLELSVLGRRGSPTSL
ncbi:hypothetical protein [Paraburkholderia gardini]|uniref:hypothetical protein n=1 Tax=Paraburkholderia gardini TaxID=2823469 RepID=UPI001E4AAB7F|nr:hypothetical protein [Paraburkholderia gardini]